MSHCRCRRTPTLRALLPLVLLACFSADALADAEISGVAQNLSRGEPAPGDEVALLRLDRGMQEEVRSKTDLQGKFFFHVRSPYKSYVVRVIHQGVNYDQRVPPTGTVALSVFDAARAVAGITGTIEILRTGTKGNLLHVSDMYEIENNSRPPLTQSGERTFEVYLPREARIDSVLAAGPGNAVEVISAASASDGPGHYTVNFPLQPGATKFAFNYDLPYDGRAAFRTRHWYSVQEFAVMIPATMKFSSPPALFQSLPTANAGYQVFAANRLRAGEGPRFEIAGAGALPSIGDRPKPQTESRPTNTSGPKPLARPANPTSLSQINLSLSQAQTSSQSVVLTGITAILFLVCVVLVRRARKS